MVISCFVQFVKNFPLPLFHKKPFLTVIELNTTLQNAFESPSLPR